jgi:hypothetical protein
VDASSFPGKAFEMTFEMPEKDVGIMTFNKCVSVEQWEASSTGTNPAAYSRFCSLNTADLTLNVYDECIENVFSNTGQIQLSNRYWPSSEGIFCCLYADQTAGASTDSG